MAHAKDDLGYPLDPELRRLEFRLGDLAAMWRDAGGSIGDTKDILREYHAVFARLYELGWDAVLDVQSELPDAFMPEEYMRRNGPSNDKW